MVIGFFVFRDTFTPSLSGDASDRSSAFELLPSDKTGNTMPDVEKADSAREDEDAVDDNGDGVEELQARYAEVSNNPDYPRLDAY